MEYLNIKWIININKGGKRNFLEEKILKREEEKEKRKFKYKLSNRT